MTADTTQGAIERAIRAAQACGLKVVGISPDGTVLTEEIGAAAERVVRGDPPPPAAGIKKRKVRTKAIFPQPGPQQIGLSLRETCAITGIGLRKIREAVASGSLPSRRLGKRHVVMRPDAERFLASLREKPSPTEPRSAPDRPPAQ